MQVFKKKQKDLQEINLKKVIDDLENNSDESLQQSLLVEKKIELENLRKEKVRGHITRSRIQWLYEGEKPTSFFCNLEKQNFVEKTIRKLQTRDNSVLTEQKSILKEVENFYKKLFQNKDDFFPKTSPLSTLHLPIEKKVKDQNLGKEISVKELGEALKNMKNNKSPGIDGFPADFLKVFWAQLKFYIANAINCSFKKGKLSPSLR